MNTFAKNLKARRLECGMTQKQVAHMAGVDVETYYRYERGTNSPRLDRAVWIAAALGVQLSQLIDGDTEITPLETR